MEVPQVIGNAHRLANSFSALPEAEAQPAVIVVSGLPGTGKSFFCRQLAERLPYLILESDALRKQLFSNPIYSAEESYYLFRTIHHLMADMLKKGIPIILDATNLEERNREYIYNIANQLNVKLIIVRVTAPPELVQKRLKKRVASKSHGDNSDADWKIYQQLKPTDQKISRRHFTVDTSKDITPAIDKIVREVNR